MQPPIPSTNVLRLSVASFIEVVSSCSELICLSEKCGNNAPSSELMKTGRTWRGGRRLLKLSLTVNRIDAGSLDIYCRRGYSATEKRAILLRWWFMNSLLIHPDECSGPGKAVLRGARAEYGWDIHGLREGIPIKLAVLHGLRGSGVVTNAARQRIEIDLVLDTPARTPLPFVLLVGVCRPQTVKKIIHLASMLGVESVLFVGTDRMQKSYLSSKAFSQEFLETQSMKGLEQVWDSRMPAISIYPKLDKYLEERAALDRSTEQMFRIVAAPGGESIASEQLKSRIVNSEKIEIAIGPEAGWTPREIELFQSGGFRPVGLGERTVRVEVAATMAIAQLSLYKS